MAYLRRSPYGLAVNPALTAGACDVPRLWRRGKCRDLSLGNQAVVCLNEEVRTAATGLIPRVGAGLLSKSLSQPKGRHKAALSGSYTKLPALPEVTDESSRAVRALRRGRWTGYRFSEAGAAVLEQNQERIQTIRQLDRAFHPEARHVHRLCARHTDLLPCGK